MPSIKTEYYMARMMSRKGVEVSFKPIRTEKLTSLYDSEQLLEQFEEYYTCIRNQPLEKKIKKLNLFLNDVKNNYKEVGLDIWLKYYKAAEAKVLTKIGTLKALLEAAICIEDAEAELLKLRKNLLTKTKSTTSFNNVEICLETLEAYRSLVRNSDKLTIEMFEREISDQSPRKL